jgi:predicted hydrocarbon binding protein
VLDREIFPGSDVICYCSEGFAERMFSRVAGVEVSAEVVSSVRRGDLSCVYRIELPKQASEVPSK